MTRDRRNYPIARRRWLGCILLTGVAALAMSACKSNSDATSSDAQKVEKTSIKLQLNWVPEPEFGGFFEAKRAGYFAEEGIDIEIIHGTPGVPTPQLVANGKVDFGIVTGEQIVTLRANGAALVGVFAAFQVSPRGILVHDESPHQSLEGLWKTDAKVAVEPGQAYVKWLNHKYGGQKLQLVPSQGALATFVHDRSLAQSVYVFAEPVELERREVPVRIFPVAESGYNPYEVVLATRDEFVEKHPDRVAAMIRATRKGWESYLNDPEPTNRLMATMNPAMSFDAMQKASELSKNYIRPPSVAVGSMSVDRWSQLLSQLTELAVIDRQRAPNPEDCYWEPAR